jgi:D-serine deaminase-like pyridoxal phosphate-dependent protein
MGTSSTGMVGNRGTESAISLNPKADETEEPTMTPAADPNIDRLKQLCDQYQESLAATNKLRYSLDKYIQALKQEGYSYSTLAEHSCFAQGTIQLIIAKKLSEND